MTDDDRDTPLLGPTLVTTPPEADEPDGLELDERQIQEMRSIFATSLPQYLDPLDEMCRQLLSGTAGPEVEGALQAAAGALRQAAEKMSFQAVADLLARLEEAVGQALAPGAGEVSRERRELILGLLLDLRQIAEDFGGAQEKLHGTSLGELLGGMPGAGEIVARLARAGLVLDVQLQGARPDEIAAVSGLSKATVGEVLEWLKRGGAPAAALAVAPLAALPPPADRSDAEAAADAIEALLAALERLASRLEETREDIQARRSQIRNLREERAHEEQELARARAAHRELERWLQSSGEVRAKLLQQRDLYATALHEAEQHLAERRAQLQALGREASDQTTELGASREALRQLETMMDRLRSRFDRRRTAR